MWETWWYCPDRMTTWGCCSQSLASLVCHSIREYRLHFWGRNQSKSVSLFSFWLLEEEITFNREDRRLLWKEKKLKGMREKNPMEWPAGDALIIQSFSSLSVLWVKILARHQNNHPHQTQFRNEKSFILIKVFIKV